MSLSGHQSARSKSVDWLTPPEMLQNLGGFDLDPCCPKNMPWRTAKTMIQQPHDGFGEPWEGRVWLNPPFGRQAAAWLMKLRDHGDGIALIPARTETEMFYENVWGHADAVCFVKTRPHFHVATDTWFRLPRGKKVLVEAGGKAPFNSGAPIALIAYGQVNYDRLVASRLGFVVDARNQPKSRWCISNLLGEPPPATAGLKPRDGRRNAQHSAPCQPLDDTKVKKEKANE